MADVLIITGLVVLLFYLFFIRPTRAEQSRRRRDLNDLRIGDEVLTRGGLIARVTAVETPPNGPMLLLLELAEGVIVKARTEAIAERLSSAAERGEDDWDDQADWDDEAEGELDDELDDPGDGDPGDGRRLRRTR